MDLSHLKHLTLAVAVLTLVGCASVPKSSGLVNQSTPELASVIGDAALGDTIALPANNSLGMDSVVVDRTYFAASGRECRRLRDINGAPIQRVACKGHDGDQWIFARNLQPVSVIQQPSFNLVSNSSVTQPIVPSAGSALLANNEDLVSEHGSLTTETNDLSVVDSESFVVDFSQAGAADTLQRELRANETLWKFAKRTTGNALNWKTIAELNNITDAKTLAPGAQLTIPVALVREGG